MLFPVALSKYKQMNLKDIYCTLYVLVYRHGLEGEIVIQGEKIICKGLNIALRVLRSEEKDTKMYFLNSYEMRASTSLSYG